MRSPAVAKEGPDALHARRPNVNREDASVRSILKTSVNTVVGS